MIDCKYKLALLDQRPAVMMGREEWLYSSYYKSDSHKMVLVHYTELGVRKEKREEKRTKKEETIQLPRCSKSL